MDKPWLEAEVFQQFETQVKILIPLSNDDDQLWSWRVERIWSKHILLRFGLHYGSLRPRWYSLIWPKGRDLVMLDTPEKFVQLVTDEGMTLEHNLADILYLFCFYHNGQDQQKKILNYLTDIDSDFIVAEPDRVTRYRSLVSPPLYVAAEQQVSFWAIDWLEQSLEKWLIVSTKDGLKMRLLIQEKDFFI